MRFAEPGPTRIEVEGEFLLSPNASPDAIATMVADVTRALQDIASRHGAQLQSSVIAARAGL